MFERECTILRFMQGYGDQMLADIEPDAMCRQPVPGMNHPAWIIGHLAFAADGHARYVGGEPQLGEWKERFGFGSRLTTNLTDYPSKEALVDAWHAANERYIVAVQAADPAVFDEPTQGPLGEHLPRLGQFISFSMTGHTSLHLGQLSAWRRADGRPALF